MKSVKEILYDTAYMCNLKKMVQMNLFTKQKYSHRCKKNKLWLPRREGWVGINQEIGIDIHALYI